MSAVHIKADVRQPFTKGHGGTNASRSFERRRCRRPHATRAAVFLAGRLREAPPRATETSVPLHETNCARPREQSLALSATLVHRLQTQSASACPQCQRGRAQRYHRRGFPRSSASVLAAPIFFLGRDSGLTNGRSGRQRAKTLCPRSERGIPPPSSPPLPRSAKPFSWTAPRMGLVCRDVRTVSPPQLRLEAKRKTWMSPAVSQATYKFRLSGYRHPYAHS